MEESDWKLFQKLRELALERLSRNILDEIRAVCAIDTKSCHHRYLDVFKLTREREKEMAAAFDDPRRSTGIRQLAFMVAGGWVTDEELLKFSEETRRIVEIMIRP